MTPYDATLDTFLTARNIDSISLAQRLGIATRNVDRWRRGEASPQLAQRLALAKELGIHPDVLYDLLTATKEAANDTPDDRTTRLLVACADRVCDSIPVPKRVDLLRAMIIKLLRQRLQMRGKDDE